MIKRLIQLVFLATLVIAGLVLIQPLFNPPAPRPPAPTPFIVRSAPGVTPQVVATSVVPQLPEKTIPAPIVTNLGDPAAMRVAIEAFSFNQYENFKSIESLDTGGVATVSQNRYGITDFVGNPLPGQTFTMTYQSEYWVRIHAGTDDTLFWSTGVIDTSWAKTQSTDPVTGGEIITNTGTVTATFTLPVCVTSIEKIEGQSITYKTAEPSPEVMYLLERIPGWQPFTPDLIRNQSESAARKDALNPEHVNSLYGTVATDAAPGGKFFQWLKDLVFANTFGFPNVNLVIKVDSNQKIRCDGSPIE